MSYIDIEKKIHEGLDLILTQLGYNPETLQKAAAVGEAQLLLTAAPAGTDAAADAAAEEEEEAETVEEEGETPAAAEGSPTAAAAAAAATEGASETPGGAPNAADKKRVKSRTSDVLTMLGTSAKFNKYPKKNLKELAKVLVDHDATFHKQIKKELALKISS